MSSAIFEQKRSQEYIYLQKVDPKFRDFLHKKIVRYDLEHSPLKILRQAQGDYEKMISGLKASVAERELFLIKIVDEVNLT